MILYILISLLTLFLIPDKNLEALVSSLYLVSFMKIVVLVEIMDLKVNLR